MSLFGGITDWLTGGANGQAEQALNDALAAYSNIQAPTQAQLSLPQLQEYVNAGMMTPAQAQAYLQQSNAFSTENVPQTGTAAQVASLNQLQGIANAGAAGTPVEQAQIAQAIQQMNESVAGQEGAIQQQMQAKGTPGALIQAALETQDVGQAAQQAYQNSLNAQANAYQNSINAMTQGANVGANLQGQENTQANTVAQAQNAMQQFNAANQQQASALNAQLKQQANQYNTQNAQNVANQNTGLTNSRTAYNTGQAQTAFDDAMQRAQGMADVYAKQAGNYQAQGQQNAGTAAGIFGGLSNLGQSAMTANALNGLGSPGAGANGISEGFQPGVGQISGPANLAQYAPPIATAAAMAHGGMVGGHEGCYHDGGICMERGGMVPGQAKVPGDSLKNDHIHAMLSPGEAVIPRTAVAQHMPEVTSLIAGAQGPRTPHPHDVATVLQALKELRMGVPSAA